MVNKEVTVNREEAQEQEAQHTRKEGMVNNLLRTVEVPLEVPVATLLLQAHLADSQLIGLPLALPLTLILSA